MSANTGWRSAEAVIALLIPLTLLIGAGCRKAVARDGDILPGRSRPLLEHDWAHPRDLRFEANRFEPPDAQAALVVTHSGLRAYVLPADDPLVQVTAAVPLGRAFEQADEPGAADLLSSLLARQIRERLGREFTGRVQVEEDVDLTRVSLQMFADEWREGLSALIGVLRRPHLDQRTIDAYRTGPGYTRQTRGLGGPAFRPAVELARRAGGYPLAPPDAGLPVRRATISRLVSRSLRPDTVVLGIGGGVSREDAERALHELTSGWDRGVTPPETPSAAPSPGPPSARLHAIDEPGFTTWIALGHPVPPIRPPHEAAVAVMTEIVNIRLNIAVREMRGLANQAVLHVPATTRHGGLLHVRTGGRPESVAPLIHYSMQELSAIREADGAPTNDELEQAKGGLVLSRWQRALDGARAASATYATETARHGSLQRLTAWPDAVRAATAEDVRSVADEYLKPDRMTTVIIGQIDAIRTARHPRWPVTLDEVEAAQRRSSDPR